jgi:hypothetical protein
MNEFLRQEIRKTTQAARSTWDADLAHDLLDVVVRAEEKKIAELDTELRNLLFAALKLNRRHLHNQDHITSML